MGHFGGDRFDDYMEMKIALGEDDDWDSNNSAGGNNSGCFPVFLGVLLVLWLLSLLAKLF